MRITQQAYGKSNVRLSHITRKDNRHDFIELNAHITLSGGFDAAYTSGDNSLVVPTDTMKNTVYALAKQHGVTSIESFARMLSQHFTKSFDHVDKAHVALQQRLWTRIDTDGQAHGHAFTGGTSEQNTCEVTATADAVQMRSGFDGLQALKTTDSGFMGFLKDDFTTLKETDDRIFATTITATWPCANPTANWTAIREQIRAAMLYVFSHRYSTSVQKTLHEMATAAFAACIEIDEISIKMPNQHHLLADLSPLNLENPNEVFVPTLEPFGVISATLTRNGAAR